MSMNQPDATANRTIDIAWDESGTPIATRFDDPYYSRMDGRMETQHVFLGLNDLPRRWATKAEFTIAELGFGTGLNFLETLATWRTTEKANTARLTYVSFERFPMTSDDLARAISRWPELRDDCAHLLAHWPPPDGFSEINFGDDAALHLTIGDANMMVPAWQGMADAWFLDGFSPAKNPEMWGEALMHAVCDHTEAGGTFATFTAAGWVRRNLQVAGFDVSKAPGYGHKRECLLGRKAEPFT